MGVFSKSNNPKTELKRNTFDLSFQNNLTLNFGGLYPVFCKEVLPGDTFNIKTSFGLNFMPTVFPIQNKIRADIHYFYVRSRNCWDEFKKFITNSGTEKSMPYLSSSSLSTTTTDGRMFSTGSIYDYMGLPSTISYSEFSPSSYRDTRITSGSSAKTGYASYSVQVGFTPEIMAEGISFLDVLKTSGITNLRTNVWPDTNNFSNKLYPVLFFDTPGEFLADYPTFNGTYPISFNAMTFLNDFISKTPVATTNGNLNTFYIPSDIPFYFCFIVTSTYSGVTHVLGSTPLEDLHSVMSAGLPHFVSLDYDDTDLGVDEMSLKLCLIPRQRFTDTVSGNNNLKSLTYVTSENSTTPNHSVAFGYLPGTYDPIHATSVIPLNPISSLPFRAYESIYNSFYRDERNNPLIINGKPTYDQYLTSVDGGRDTFHYAIRRRNWEQDFLTSALPSPQQGTAPLVGISATGRMTFSDPETGKTYTAIAKTADDADTIIGADFETPDAPNSVRRSLVNYATSGLSINDFRNVNALQRYLETNLRRGLKYKDQLESRFGVNISYAELDMPEFIGGVTQDVTPSRINQTTDNGPDSPLGSYAGQLMAFGSSQHDVNHYCDEHGYIIGILSVVPVPVYSQLIPKHFYKSDPLDYFNPEFGHIGLQPIPVQEILPLNVSSKDPGELMDTFGYQRAWYDYLASTDEVHGQFRTSLNNFLMYRQFAGKPVLSPNFLLVDPSQLNDVFAVQDDSDKIMGSVYFDCKVRRPIPRYGTPRLE